MVIAPACVPNQPLAQLPCWGTYPSDPWGVGTHPWLCLDVLPQEPLLIEGVPGFPRNGIDGPFVNLLFDRTDQQEEGLSHRLLGKGKKTK